MADEHANQDDRVVALLERTLASRAQGAAARPDLAARARSQRRRTVAVRATSAVAAVAVAGLSAVTLPGLLNDDGDVAPSDTTLRMAPADGWRWETYGGIELEVPEDWGYGTSEYPWCVSGGVSEPYVGRPEGLIPLILCSDAVAPIDQRVPYLWFGLDADPTIDLGDGWVQETFGAGPVFFTVLTDDPSVRDHIVNSAHPVVASDGNGCDADATVASDAGDRPDLTTGLPAPDDATGAVICVYNGASNAPTGVAPLLASERLGTAETSTLLAALLAGRPSGAEAASPGCVPNPEDPATLRTLLVQVESSVGTQDVYLTAACGELRVDDGTQTWAAGPDATAALAHGPIAMYTPTSPGETVPSVG